MKVLLVGGGSGGHITPLLAVAHELRHRHPQASIWYALEKGSRFDELPRTSKDITEVYTVRAGKFRRYHGDSWLKRILDVPTNLKNIRDGVYLVIGYFQSRRLLRRLQPDVVFIKGSSVGVPIGKACSRLGIPYFTHDSDSVASLTNKILSKNAVVHAVGLPLDFYTRQSSKMRFTGIPLSDSYQAVDARLQSKYRHELGLPDDAQAITVTGGSLGAQRLNDSFKAVASGLLQAFPNLYIVHQTGNEQSIYEGLSEEQRHRVQEVAFSDRLASLTGAADVVISRAGATTIAELAVQGKACIFIPNPQLTGGQQSQNSKFLEKHGAAIILQESEAADHLGFEKVIAQLLRNSSERAKLVKAIKQVAKPDATTELTDIIENIADKKIK